MELQGYSGDGGLATSAELNYPSGVAVDSNGNIYIADTRNHLIRVLTIFTLPSTTQFLSSGDSLTSNTYTTTSIPSPTTSLHPTTTSTTNGSSMTANSTQRTSTSSSSSEWKSTTTGKNFIAPIIGGVIGGVALICVTLSAIILFRYVSIRFLFYYSCIKEFSSEGETKS